MSAGSNARTQVLVAGGGLIGLFSAWRAAQRGLRVTLVDAGEPGSGASHVAAGMLAPVTEAEFGAAGRQLLELGLAGLERWRAAAPELAAAAGIDPALREDGTLVLARDADEAEALERERRFREELGLPVAPMLPSAARRAEPALAPTLRAALDVPGDHSVDPRATVAALVEACRREGVAIRPHVRVAAVCGDGVTLDGGERLAAGRVVLAAGAWTGRLVEGVPVRPVKGQIVRLRDPSGPGLVSRVLRFEGGYLVPRGDGRYVLGATMEERGFDTTVTVGGLYELIRDATELVPGLSELVVEESTAGLRPGTPDNLPIIGRAPAVGGSGDGVVLATGHHRNGVLLAPLTGDLVAGLLCGDAPDPLLAACDPARFARVAA